MMFNLNYSEIMEADGEGNKGATKGDKDLSVEDYEIKQRSEDND